MKFLPYVLKHLRHNWVRTGSTVTAMALCIFLWCTLETFVAAVTYNLQSAKDSRLVVRHKVSLVFSLPPAYKERIASIPGVVRVASSNWFGGVYQKDMKNFFPNFAVDAEEYLEMYPEYILDPGQKAAFLADRKGCIIGPGLKERFGFDLEKPFQLESIIPTHQKAEPFEFIVRGIYQVDDAKYPGTYPSVMLFHRKYLYEGTGERANPGTFVVQIADAAKAAAISQEIDTLFENSEAETRTETEAAFRAGFVSLAGNLALLLESIGLAVTFTILLVTANTLSMSVRERRTEIGVLKTLGFTSRLVMGLILTEAIVMGLLGGALGIGLASGMIRALPRLPFIGDAVRGFPALHLTPSLALLGFAVALGVSFASGIVPAVLAFRAKVTTVLRPV